MTRTDRCRCPRAALALAALALAAGCGRASMPPPRPAAVEPPVALAAAGAAVVIRGDAFYLGGAQSLDAGGSEVEAPFRAWAGDTELLDVRWVDEATLHARVPAGLAPGRYDVAVENAFGRGVAPGALELVAGMPAALAATATFPAKVAVGQEATLVVEVENRGDGTVRGATPVLAGVDPAHLAPVAASDAPQDLGPGARWPFRWTFRGAAPGDVAIAVAVAGTDARTGAAVAAASLEVPASVRRAAVLTAAARLDRPEALVGGQVVARLDVTNAGPAAVRELAVVPVLPPFLGGAAPPPARSLAPGETATFDLPFTAVQAGSGALAFDVTAVDDDFGLPVAAARAGTDVLVARVPPVLAAAVTATPGWVSTGQDVAVTLTVENRGGTAADVAPSLAFSGTGVLAPLGAAPAAARVEPGRAHAFAWALRAAGPGEVAVAARADGLDAVSGAPVSIEAAGGPVVVQAPAFLTATAVATPEAATVGQSVELRVTVANTGGAAAELAASLAIPASVLSVVSGPPTAPARLEPGTAVTLRWTLAAEAPGDAALLATVAASDVNSGAPVGVACGATVAVDAPARLEAELSATPDPVNDGQELVVRMRVRNLGDAAALDVAPAAPSLSGTGSAQLVSGPHPVAVAGAAPAAAVPGGGETWFEWRYEGRVAGRVAWTAGAAGLDAHGGWPVSAPAATVAVDVQRRAELAAGAVAVPGRVNVGQPFAVRVPVSNHGDAVASGVTAAVALAPASVAAAGDPPGPVDLAGDGSTELVRWFVGASPGTAEVSAAVTGTDATDRRPLTAPAPVATVVVERPAALSATLALPGSISVGEIAVTMAVANGGDAAADGVLPGALAILPASTARAEIVSAPTEAVDLPRGGSASFGWRLRVLTAGTLQVAATASGVDANDGGDRTAHAESVIAPAARDWARVLAADPLGDGSRFAFVTSHGGAVYVGPSRSGTGLARVPVDGTPAQSLPLAFPRDTVGNTHSNSVTPYTSIGYTGCAINSAANACGPDNEDGRGLLTSVVLGGEEWLVLGGARSGGDLDYVYLARGDLSAPTFQFVDLSAVLGGNTRGFSAALASGGRLYLGFPDNGGNRPYGISLLATPAAGSPGLNALPGTHALDLDLQEAFKKALGSFASVAMVDAIAELGGRLYFFNNVGCIVSIDGTPETKDDFLGCSPPLSTVYDPKSSVEPTRQHDLEPRDRAWPQTAVWKGWLYAIRNTYTGPQLWACNPARAGGASAVACDPGDWALIAPDGALRTRLGKPGATAASLLVATPRHLYLGLDDPGGGVHVFRTAVDRPAATADFTGRDGCVAGTVGCEGIGGDGLGDPSTLIRIFDGKAIETADGTTDVYLTAGDGAAPVRVIRIGD